MLPYLACFRGIALTPRCLNTLMEAEDFCGCLAYLSVHALGGRSLRSLRGPLHSLGFTIDRPDEPVQPFTRAQLSRGILE